MKTKAFKAALPYTLPICVGFLFLGMSYGFLMRSKGFSVGYPLFMSMFISAVVSLSSPVSLSAGLDGQCQALVLWNLHAG